MTHDEYKKADREFDVKINAKAYVLAQLASSGVTSVEQTQRAKELVELYRQRDAMVDAYYSQVTA